jgi:hypothetical protein
VTGLALLLAFALKYSFEIVNLGIAAWTWIAVSVTVIACSTGPTSSGNCCDVGPSQGVPSCICGTTTFDGGSCKVASVVGATCSISCDDGMATAGGQTATSCTDQ